MGPTGRAISSSKPTPTKGSGSFRALWVLTRRPHARASRTQVSNNLCFRGPGICLGLRACVAVSADGLGPAFCRNWAAASRLGWAGPGLARLRKVWSWQTALHTPPPPLAPVASSARESRRWGIVALPSYSGQLTSKSELGGALTGLPSMGHPLQVI